MSESVLIYDVDKAMAELCRRKLSRFVQEFWSVIIAEPLVWEPHLQVLCDEVQAVYERLFLRDHPEDLDKPADKRRKMRMPKKYDLVINVPPGSSKSTIVTVMAPAWGWTNDPTLRYISSSYSGDLSTEHSTKSREIVESDKYQAYYPEVRIKDHKGLKTNYETTKNGQRYATSVGGTVTGIHAHLLIYDDLLNAKQAVSQDLCKVANTWMDQTGSTRKVDKNVTATILVMQRLAVNDPTGYLLEKKKENLRHVCLPATLSKEVKPEEYKQIYQDGLLSPIRMSAAALADQKLDLGSAGYAGQFDMLPVPEGGTIWQRKWFIEIPDEDFPDIKKAHEVRSDWDLAFTKEDKNSASAYVTTGLYGGRCFIFDFDWKWLEYPELIKWMRSRVGPHDIEAKASGKSAKQSLVKRGIIAREVKVTGDKIARAKDATPLAEAGMVCIKKSMADRFFNDSKQGILFFPNGQYNDLADALSQALSRRTVSGKLHVSSPTRDEDEDFEEDSMAARPPLSDEEEDLYDSL